MPSHNRSRSNSSSSSSSSDSGDDWEKKQKKALKKARKAQKKHAMSGYEGYGHQEQHAFGMPSMPSYGAEQPHGMPDQFAGAHPQGPYPGHHLASHDFPGPTMPEHQRDMATGAHAHMQSPPAANAPPPSGYRVPLTADAPFPGADIAGEPPCRDADGSPVYIGSALLEKSVHPCKVAPHLRPPARIGYGGTEHEHHGRFDLLPFSPNLMEWVHTSNGHMPPGRRPVEGGYEEGGQKLYHGLAEVSGVHVPGKTGEHLGGCNVAFGGGEHVVREYYILCWR